MAYTATQLAQLEAVRASGELRVKFQLGDKITEKQFQTGADLDAAIRMARADVAAASTGASAIYRGTTRYLEFSRG